MTTTQKPLIPAKAERQLLSCIMQDDSGEVWKIVNEHGITADSFGFIDDAPERNHRAIFAAIKKATEQGIEPDYLAVAKIMGIDGDAVRVSELSTVHLSFPSIDGSTLAPNARMLSESIREKQAMREWRKAIEDAARGLDEGTALPLEIVADFQKMADRLGGTPTTKHAELIAMLEARRYDHENPPPRPVPVFTLDGKNIATRGNIINLQAQAKAGKTSVIGSMLAATTATEGADTFSIESTNPEGKAVIHFDTEQSRFDADRVIRNAMRRAGVDHKPEWLHSYSLADCGIGERLQLLEAALTFHTEGETGVHSVFLDGVGDLCANSNDIEESQSLVAHLHRLAINHDCVFVTVLHENPGAIEGKARGHLGSELERKAETPLRLTMDAEGITTIYAPKARHCSIPQSQGVCFRWDDAAMMHISCGNRSEIKADRKREEAEELAAEVFSNIEKSTASYTELCAEIGIIRECSEATAKRHLKAVVSVGAIHKHTNGANVGKYSLRRRGGIKVSQGIKRVSMTPAGEEVSRYHPLYRGDTMTPTTADTGRKESV